MTKRKLSISILACTLGMAIATPSLATLSWDTCSIKRIGAQGEAKLVKIDSCNDNSFNNNKWLNISKQENASLAILLTALSLGKKVKMNAHFNTANTTAASGSNIEIIYLDQ